MVPKRVHLFYMVLIAATSSLGRAEERSLDEILMKWEQATAQIKRLDCRFKRFEYQGTLRVERRAEGTIAIDSPQQAVVTIDAPAARIETVSRKKDSQGVPYSIRQEEPAHLIWIPGEVVHVDLRAGTYRRMKSEDNPSLAQFPSVSSFISGCKANDLRDRFEMTLPKQTGSEIWLTLKPKAGGPAKTEAFSEAQLILDAETLLPKAIRLHSPAPSRDSTVFTFSEVRINQGAARKDSLALLLEQLREEK